MIHHLELVLRSGAEYMKDRLETGFFWLKERGYLLTLDERESDEATILYLTLCGPDHSGVFQDRDIISIFHHQLSELLAETITLWWETGLIRRRIEREYRNLARAEQLQLSSRARDFMRRDDTEEGLNLILKFGRKSRIAQRIYEHLSVWQTLNLDGIVNFRLKEYQKEIRFAVDLANEDLKNERQFNEFVRLLKHYVDTQPSKVVEVNIQLNEPGAFRIWDEKGLAIDSGMAEFCMDDLAESAPNLDDLLISMLISLAPKRLIFHSRLGFPENEPTRIIRKVFKDKIMVCHGCDRCNAVPADHR
ncbi:MAG: sporulation protein YtxC [Solirubrobacterales bacterium]